ncbi:MAG: glycoside hydrolase family 113 [Ktedonobacterales bacterium]
MPLTPSPLIPGTSPLPNPGQQPPNRRAIRVGALLSLLVLILTLGAGQILLLHIVFFAPGLEAQANSSTSSGAPAAMFQGFVYPWTRAQSGGGYTTPASLENMESEAKIFHMNSVIIPVVGNMPLRDDSTILWQSTDNGDKYTLPDSDYEQAISDAKKAGLVPILKLEVRQEDPLSGGSESSQYIGEFWSDYDSSTTTTLPNGASITVGPTERQWFDNYAAFAVHYAQMSQQYHLPFFIFGSDLTSVSYDTAGTGISNDPHGIENVPGETCTNPTGRRDCEWRHVIHALRQSIYTELSKNQTETGASYTGKLIYEASWSAAPQAQTDGATAPEYMSIPWWDAVDYIGIDAEFPLTPEGADVPVNDLEAAWNGQTTTYGAGGSGDVVGNLESLSQKFQKPILFTTAGYDSAAGANTGQPTSNPDQGEQLFDMQALLETFEGQSWWDGVFWSADYPIAPRSSQPDWTISSNWAGDTLASSKTAGQWLAGHYKNNPLP